MVIHISASAEIDPSVFIGDGTKIWDATQIRDGSSVGSDCTIGRMVYVGPNVVVGNRVKIQNSSIIYEPCVLHDGVFIGPNVVITNDKYPRAVNSDGSVKSGEDWDPVGTIIKEGASLGAGSVCVAPLVIGKWAVIAAGSVVTKDVADFALVAGVPARRIGWVGPAGVPLKTSDQVYFNCPVSGLTFKQISQDILELQNN
jgi:acetyltransferase-like isoleucine patch superfamily enzyme